ncbi:helix-turn-helix transcriptional regulator [Cryobacterium sp. SO1]|uniref:helix-turn-helix transcriptional regulator n=1 Tax=Cryobacterium sp. SO1 TaxID=1897061 RepID=UPI0010E3A015|nr:helix-turn-helix transcriptional regulator [Cryobacterium sp. SO1]RZI34205.1 hypothetical protein BJQ95_03345 [Cryobacterium sp. SO1]
MNIESELKDFLRASRAKLLPTDVGLGDSVAQGFISSRRVPGLRREEVALVAGVSVDYYARLEQGRTRHVSDAVLSAVASALRLNGIEKEYLFALVAKKNDVPHASAHGVPARVKPSVQRTLAAFTTSPAVVMGLGMRILAMNSLARSVYFDFTKVAPREQNLARWTFLSPEARILYSDWETAAAESAAVIRADAGSHPEDAALNELIGELTVRSEDFRRLWAQHGVHRCGFGTIRLAHPIAGPMSLDYQALDVPGEQDQKVVVYMAPEGSPSEDSLRLLSSWTAKTEQAIDVFSPSTRQA